MATSTYFERFFDEKDIPYTIFEVEDPINNDMHMVDSEFVIDLIKGTTGQEAAKLEDVLTRLDFANAPILPFLRHLATGFIANL